MPDKRKNQKKVNMPPLKTHISPLISFLISVVFSPVNLNWQNLPHFLRKALGKIKITIAQYQFYLFLVKFLKRLCLSAFMAILNLVTFFIQINLALGKSARQIMHWYKLLNQSVTQLTTMSLAVAFLLI